MAIANKERIPLEEGMSLRILADIQLAMGNPLEDVIALYEKSLAGLVEDSYETACTKARWGLVLWEKLDKDQGKALLLEAHSKFKALHAKRDLLELEPVLSKFTEVSKE